MAVTIDNNPPAFSPVYNPIVYVVSSTNTAQANFQYVADVYITGVTTPTYFRLKRPADSDHGGRNYFDISNILRSYVTHNILKSDNNFKTNDNSFVEYTVKFGESYGPSSAVTVYPDLTVDSARLAWNGVLDPIPFRAYAGHEYVMFNSSRKFLTARPSTAQVWRGEDAWLYMQTSGSNVVETYRLRTYDIDGTIIDTCTFTNPFATLSGNTGKFLRIPAGANINDMTWLCSGNPISASVYSYDITMLDSGAAASSETLTFKISPDCTAHTIYTLHFLNKLGGFDTFTFTQRNDQDSTIERAQYKKILGDIGGDRTKTATQWGYDNDDRGKVTYTTKIKDKITVHSGFVDESTQNWLEELFTSPEVYYDDPTNGFVAVNILSTSYRKVRAINDRLFNVTLEFEFGYDRVRQTR